MVVASVVTVSGSPGVVSYGRSVLVPGSGNGHVAFSRQPAGILGPGDGAPAGEGLPFDGMITIDEAERRLILRAMKTFKGNKSHVARALGISRKQLYVKLTEYGIHGPKESEPDAEVE